MGDRCTVSIKFGGKISEAQATTLLELMEPYDFSVGYGGGGALTLDDFRNPSDEDFIAEEINYEKWNGAGGDYSEAVERFDGTKSVECAFCDGPTIPLSDILQVETLASCLAPLIAKARFMLDPFPELEVVR
jgi:hypothetical protein